MYFIDKNTALTIERIEKYIEDFKFRYQPRLLKNKRYFDCKNDTIMNRTFQDITKPNNKCAHPFSEYIVTLISGYFAGAPVTYDTQSEDLKNILSSYTVKEVSHNQSLAKDCSIYGIAAELLFINTDKQVQFEKIEPSTVIPIYSTDITKELIYCIRFWDSTDILTNETTTNIEVYDSREITYYSKSVNGTVLTGKESHYFKEVPINIYYNNEDLTGDAEKVHTLIDGLDNCVSDDMNFRALLQDSYLVFRNTHLDEEAIITMKQNRIICIEDTENGMQSDVSWLNKDSNNSESENIKNRLASDIKMFSCISELENKSHTTATAARLSLLSLEQKCAIKETYFRKALLNRWEMVCNYYNLLGSNITIEDLKITFIRNLPTDFTALADSISKFAPYISKRSLISQIPFISDIDGELSAMEQENSINSYDEDILSGDDDEQ